MGQTDNDSEVVSGPKIHVVEAGEHLSSISERYGFADFEQIWMADANAELRQKRKDPHQLVPGDQLAIPGRRLVKHRRQTGQTHVFRVHVEKTKLRLKLLDVADEPLVNTPCILSVDGAESELVTDSGGFVETKIPRSAGHAALAVLGQTYALGIGDMTPPDADNGVHMRLRNLGYVVPSADGAVDRGELGQALREFQAAHGLAVTGEPDELTRDKLVEQHGC